MLLLLALLGYAVVVVFLNVLFMPHGLLERDWSSGDGDVMFFDPGGQSRDSETGCLTR